MTNAAGASEPSAQSNPVWVYGNDHSPWVQAVLLGLHQKGTAHTLATLPPLAVFLNSGVLMPAVKIGDGPALLDSERILVELGFSEVDPEMRRALGSVFLAGAMHRTDDGWEFWSRFSRARDDHPSPRRRLWNHFWRAFSIFYFFTLIRLGRRRAPKIEDQRLVERFAFFQDRLRPGEPFLGGAAPDTADLQLFGLVQMYASIPGPSLAVLRDDSSLEPLRQWASAMQRRFSDHEHLYSARVFEPKRPEITGASALERTVYWAGAAFMWLAFPVTVPLVFYFVRRVRKRGLLRD